MKTWYLYVLVFVAGASVLAVEILGTRILGPFYGVSLFLWSALITVTLAALSVGYILGGRWADKGPKITRLCYVVAGAGLWLLFVPCTGTNRRFKPGRLVVRVDQLDRAEEPALLF